MQLKKWHELSILTVDFWDFCMKLSCMNTHRVDQKSLKPYRSTESSPKQSKNADMDQTGYAIEKVTWTSSRIIDLIISNPFSTFGGHFGYFWPFWRSQNQSESAKMNRIGHSQYTETQSFSRIFDYWIHREIQLFGIIGSIFRFCKKVWQWVLTHSVRIHKA